MNFEELKMDRIFLQMKYKCHCSNIFLFHSNVNEFSQIDATERKCQICKHAAYLFLKIQTCDQIDLNLYILSKFQPKFLFQTLFSLVEVSSLKKNFEKNRQR